MKKDIIKGLICGFLIHAVLFTGIPVSAETGGSTLSDKLITAITGNNANTKLSNIDSKLSTLNTNISNLTTAVNNSKGAGNNRELIENGTITFSSTTNNTSISKINPDETGYICLVLYPYYSNSSTLTLLPYLNIDENIIINKSTQDGGNIHKPIGLPALITYYSGGNWGGNTVTEIINATHTFPYIDPSMKNVIAAYADSNLNTHISCKYIFYATKKIEMILSGSTPIPYALYKTSELDL